MKICPQCDRTYHDDELNFCLMCGTALVDGASQPTIAISGSSEATVVMDARATMVEPKRRGPLFWIGVTVGSIVGVTAATFGLFFLYFLINGDSNKNYNRDRNTKSVNVAKTPVKSTPKPTPTPTETPVSEANTATVNGEDESTPISWASSTVEFKGDDGDTYTFQCPENGTASAVWGSDVYTEDSSICTAAVHAGVITLDEGGEVTIEFRPGRSVYGGTTRNGITTNTYGEHERSFIVR